MTTEPIERPGTSLETASGSQSPRFETLNTIGQLVSGLGWALAILGLVGGLASLTKLGVAGLAVMLIAPLYGILIVGYGQALQCVVAISRNTERTTELLESQRVR